MNHLNDTELVQLVYDDCESQIAQKWLDHVAQCADCQSKLNRLKRIAGCLDGSVLARSPAAESQPKTVAVVESIPVTRNWNGLLIAASIMILIGGLGFLAGSVWQQRHIERQIASRLSSEMLATRIDAAVDQVKQRYTTDLKQSLDQKLNDFSRSLDEFRTAQTASAAASNKQIESLLIRLADNQTALRQELETLALTAEAEIAAAKRDIEILNQFALSLGVGTE